MNQNKWPSISEVPKTDDSFDIRYESITEKPDADVLHNMNKLNENLSNDKLVYRFTRKKNYDVDRRLNVDLSQIVKRVHSLRTEQVESRETGWIASQKRISDSRHQTNDRIHQIDGQKKPLIGITDENDKELYEQYKRLKKGIEYVGEKQKTIMDISEALNKRLIEYNVEQSEKIDHLGNQTKPHLNELCRQTESHLNNLQTDLIVFQDGNRGAIDPNKEVAQAYVDKGGMIVQGANNAYQVLKNDIEASETGHERFIVELKIEIDECSANERESAFATQAILFTRQGY